MGRSACRIREITYEPLPSQKRFHACAARFKGFSGPVGSGKSQALCQEAIKLSYQNTGRVGLIGAPTYPMLRDVTQTTLFEILHVNSIPHDYNKAENVLSFNETGSRILFRQVDDFERLRGTNLAWFGLDELTYTQEAAWLRLAARLRDPKATRLCGFAAWTPKGYDWVYQRFISDPTPGYQAILAKPFENRFLLERVPDYYEQLRNAYDETFFEQEVMGSYLNLNGGLVYSAFSRADHVRDLEPDKHVPLLWAMDFNVDPMCSVVAQILGGEVRVIDEIALRHATTLEACEEFQRRFPRHFAGIRIYGDASGNHAQTTGKTDYQTVKDFFRSNYAQEVEYMVPNSNPFVRDRVILTNAKLRSAAGDISLLVSPRCKELIKDFEQVSYKEESTTVDKEKDRKRTHMSDALGYLLWQEFLPGEPGIGERRGRLL